MKIRHHSVLGLFLFASLAVTAAADEGMWTFDNPPVKQLKDKYNFTPAEQWLDHIRLSSVRFNDGGSGSFVSPNGLVITNHHVALGQLQKISNAQRDYVKDGFYAKTQAEELKAPDLELNVLVSMENVTSRVQGAVKPGMTEKQALDARKAEQAKIQKESLDKTGLRSDVVSLYQGGEYWLYRYKKYTEVRIVFAPEQQAAFFGGDPDNFTFPRYDLDMALFRVYENDKPIKIENYFKWSTSGAKEGELVFVPGNPGSTARLNTVAHLEYLRDYGLPFVIKLLNREHDALAKYRALGEEQSRRAQEDFFGIENSLKSLRGELEGLQDKSLIAKKAKAEEALRRTVGNDIKKQKEYGDAWENIAKGRQGLQSYFRQVSLLE